MLKTLYNDKKEHTKNPGSNDKKEYTNNPDFNDKKESGNNNTIEYAETPFTYCDYDIEPKINVYLSSIGIYKKLRYKRYF